MIHLGKTQGGIVFNPPAAPVRQGGYEFALDQTRGLWLVPENRFWGSPLSLSWDMGSLMGYTMRIVEQEPAAKPDDASPLWDNPETVTGEILAYRGWDYDYCVEPDGSVAVRLESRHQDFYWDGPVTTADQAPSAGCDHGLYAIAGTGHHEGNFREYVSNAPIWGRVALSGTVVEGAWGYRAERATIQELWVNPGDINDDDSAEGLCKALADRYQCDASVRAPSWDALSPTTEEPCA